MSKFFSAEVTRNGREYIFETENVLDTTITAVVEYPIEDTTVKVACVYCTDNEDQFTIIDFKSRAHSIENKDTLEAMEEDQLLDLILDLTSKEENDS